MKEYDYVIIGAGPAGLQLGYYLEKSGANYVILEAKNCAGSFFKKHPIHRTLLSINKINNFYTEDDFNMRHDWNSLLSDDPSLRFKHYSKSLYPDADELFRYLNDFAQRFKLNILYDTTVVRVSKQHSRFELRTSYGDQFMAARLIIATGAVEPYIPADIEGVEHTIIYPECTLDTARFTNKRVAILGKGNSAFEVANHLAAHAAYVHLFVRSPVNHAWQTHYVGDLRAINNTILDMYQLKSLHGTLGFVPKKIVKNDDGSLRITVEEDLPHWKVPGTTVTTVIYDYLIVCTGWRYVDLTIFDDSCRPGVDALGKYPVLSSSWESTVDGMYFVGTSMGARDRRSASGFIHGFRYNARSLFHILQQRYHGIDIPTHSFSLANERDLDKLADFIIKRLSTADGLYQLNGFLSDAIVFDVDSAAYSAELPIDLIKSQDSPIRKDEFATVTLEYGFHHYPKDIPSLDFIHPSDQHNTACSAFLHPIFRYYRHGQLVEEMHLGESLVVRYDLYDYEENIVGVHKNMIKNFINRIRHCTDNELDETKYPDGVFTAWTRDKLVNMASTQSCSGANFASVTQSVTGKEDASRRLLRETNLDTLLSEEPHEA